MANAWRFTFLIRVSWAKPQRASRVSFEVTLEEVAETERAATPVGAKFLAQRSGNEI